ncbi:restriction endonuclease [Streptomyces sp. NPDC057966]|uniref:restriction endonuclease n=1 Tax=Streptomyces sp. NPDC057966 TaxID=3346292 RepID=UPI0036EE9107
MAQTPRPPRAGRGRPRRSGGGHHARQSRWRCVGLGGPRVAGRGRARRRRAAGPLLVGAAKTSPAEDTGRDGRCTADPADTDRRTDDQEFEFALRDLLVRDGWTARQVGQKGDQAADVIGQHTQRGRIVLQAKHTTVGGKVDSKVMYQVKGTAGPVHRADIAVVVTNGGFTRDAKEWGERHQVHWVDRERLRQWAHDGVPLHTLLRLPARRPRRSTARRAA